MEFKMLASFLELYNTLDSLELATIMVKIVIIEITIISFVSLHVSVLSPFQYKRQQYMLTFRHLMSTIVDVPHR